MQRRTLIVFAELLINLVPVDGGAGDEHALDRAVHIPAAQRQRAEHAEGQQDQRDVFVRDRLDPFHDLPDHKQHRNQDQRVLCDIV